MDNLELYDVIIIGGGPAGVASGVYCARKELKTLFITVDFNNQSFVSADIQNWIGEKHISGLDLAKKLEDHLKDYSNIIQINQGEKVTEVKSVNCNSNTRVCDFEVTTNKGNTFKSKSVIIASGARRKRLGIPGEDKLDGKGVAFCSTCDAPLFRNKEVAVVGGGNAGLEAVRDLFQYASGVYLLEYSDKLSGDPLRADEIKGNSKMKGMILNAQVTEILGDTLVEGLKYQDKLTNQEKTIQVQGVFIEIGSTPNSEMVKNIVQLNNHQEVMITNFAHARTSHPGIFAAGDVTNDPYKQNNIAAGDGVRAALAAYAYVQNREKVSPADHQETG